MNRTIRTARAAAALALVSLAVWFGPAAVAAPVITFEDCPPTPTPGPSPTPSPSPPPEPTPTPSPASIPECMPREGQAVRGKHKLRFRVDPGPAGRLRRVELRILSDDAAIPSPGVPKPGDPVFAWNFDDPVTAPTSPRTFIFEWDTVSVNPYNGAFTIKVRATNHDGTSAERTRPDVRVDNPPSTPGPPRIVVTTPDGVTLDWGPAPEPDVVSFVVYRAATALVDERPEEDAFTRVHTTSRLTVLDEVPRAGVYWYKLQAIRRSVVTPVDGISSPRSATSQAAVVPRATPAPATPTPPGGAKPAGPTPRTVAKPPPVPDAPFAAFLPYDLPNRPQPEGPVEAVITPPPGEPESAAPRGALGVAVGAFLVSAALALARPPS